MRLERLKEPGQPAQPGESSKARLRTWLALLKASRGVETILRERLRVRWDTTLPRFDVLAALHRSEAGLGMGELSGALRVSNGNVTGIVDRLVDEALIERQAVEGDRRAVNVRLTRAGRTRFERMAADHERWVDELLGDVNERGLAALSRELPRISRRATEKDAP